ncbi:MAG: hydratase [Dehalobacterium sp.]
MLTKWNKGAYLIEGENIVFCDDIQLACKYHVDESDLNPKQAATQTIAYQILSNHNISNDMDNLKIKFDALAAHDMTYVGALQTAIACNITEFPIPFILTNCHNSLGTVSGTFNEDDHVFGLSAVKKFGGVMVPAHQAVIHQYMREMLAGGGKMILGADSHTRYGALGTMGIGEGAGELAKQLLGQTYDIPRPQTVLVYLTGTPHAGVGPMDVALELIGSVFKDGFVKNKILEFCGNGVSNLSVDFRNGIDTMTTETSCLTSIWQTDDAVREYFSIHERVEEYRELKPGRVAYYDRVIALDLSSVVPMIAMPFHPSNTYSIVELNANLEDILFAVEQECNRQMKNFGLTISLRSKIHHGRFKVDQGVIAGCEGGLFNNIVDTAGILKGKDIGHDEFSLNIYPASQPILIETVKNGAVANILRSGANIRTAFCGPCCGAGDVPANGGFSIRHCTRNFSNREGSRPAFGQMVSVALVDSRSIAATAINGGYLIPATDLEVRYNNLRYHFDSSIYKKRCLNRVKMGDPLVEIKLGPNIKPIPAIPALNTHLLLKVAALIMDSVTTTDELIPTGESSAYRSNLPKLSEYTLSAKDPQYVRRAKSIKAAEDAIMEGDDPRSVVPKLNAIFTMIQAEEQFKHIQLEDICIGSVLYARKPGDGSAREYAATCQRVLGGWANICHEYATKRYRSNLINWGIIPFTCDTLPPFQVDDYILIPNIRKAIFDQEETISAYAIGAQMVEFKLYLKDVNEKERETLLNGCLINCYKNV